MDYLQNQVNEINNSFNHKLELINKNELSAWQLICLLPKGKKIKDVDSIYLLKRVEKLRLKAIESITNEVNSFLNAPQFKSLKLSIDWKKSSTWGMNPTATLEVWTESGYASYIDKVSGCGYCKESAVMAAVLNQSASLRKLILNSTKTSYGMRGSSFSTGGVGVNSLQNAFEVLGLKLEKVASGKTYDAYRIN